MMSRFQDNGGDKAQSLESGQPVERTPLLQSKPFSIYATLRDPRAWIEELNAKLPTGTLACIFVTHHILKGFAAGGGDEGLIFKPMEFLLASQHVPAHKMQGLIALGAVSPWVLKPFVGVLIDTVPLCGQKRNPYILISTELGIIGVLGLAFGLVNSTALIVFCVFCASLQIATCTLIVDAKRSEIVKENPSFGPDLVTFTEVGMNGGIIFSAFFVGPLIANVSIQAPLYVALPLLVAPLVMVLCNWLNDNRTSVGIDFQLLMQNPWLFGMGSVLLPLLFVLACGSALDVSHAALTGCAVVASLTIIFGYTLLIRPEISGPIVLYFTFRCLSIPLNGALFYFYTNSPEKFDGGPHFSTFFYASVITFVAIAGRLVGYTTARDLFGKWHYKDVLYLTLPLGAAAQLLFVPFFGRWTTRVGIPDHLWVLVCTFLDMVARAWRHYPFSVILLQATPKGLEASTLALNTGAANMGITLSVIFGGYVLQMMDIVPAGMSDETAHFNSLWKAQILAACLPLLVLPLVSLAMPSRRQDETLILTDIDSATRGSLFERIRLRYSI